MHFAGGANSSETILRARMAAVLLLAVVSSLLITASGRADEPAEGEYPTSVVDQITLGGSELDQPMTAGTDAAGNIYVIGVTNSADFPIKGGLGEEFGPNPGYLSYQQGFVTKLDPEGEIVYSTYLPLKNTMPDAATVAADGSVYIASFENKSDGQLHVYELNPAGDELAYETVIPGFAAGAWNAIEVDAEGRAIVVGQVRGPDFPVTGDAEMPESEPGRAPTGIVRLGAGGAIGYASYLEGGAWAVTVAPDGRVYVGGSAYPGAFGDAPGAPADEHKGFWDGTVSRYSPSLRKLEYGAYLGGSGHDAVLDLAVDGQDHVFVAGQTDASPIKQVEPLDPESTASGQMNALYGELSPDGDEVLQLARLGGNGGGTNAYDIEIAPDGSKIVVGMTDAASFPAHGAPPGDLGPTAALAFRVEERQLTHSTAYVNEFRSSAMAVIPTADGLVHIVGTAMLEDPMGSLIGQGDVFVTTLRLDPYVDDPYVELPAQQRLKAESPRIKLRAGAREDVFLRAGAKIAIRVGGSHRTIRLEAPRHRADGYRKARLALAPATRGSERLLRKALSGNRKVRAKVTVGFRDRGGAVERKHASVTLSGRR